MSNKSAREYLSASDEELLHVLNTSKNQSEGPVTHAAIMLRTARSNRKLSVALFLATFVMMIATVIIALGTYEMAYTDAPERETLYRAISDLEELNKDLESSDMINDLNSSSDAHESIKSEPDQSISHLRLQLDQRLSEYTGWYDYSSLLLYGWFLILAGYSIRIIYRLIEKLPSVNISFEAHDKHSHPKPLKSHSRYFFVTLEIVGVVMILYSTFDLLYQLPLSILVYEGSSLIKIWLYWISFGFVFLQMIIGIHVLAYNMKGLLFACTFKRGFGRFIDYIYYPSIAIFTAYGGLKFAIGAEILFSGAQAATICFLLSLKILKASIDIFDIYQVCEDCPLFRSSLFYLAFKYGYVWSFMALILFPLPGIFAASVLL